MVEVRQWSRVRFSFINGTVAVCLLNIIIVMILLQCFVSSSHARSKFSHAKSDSNQLRYIEESEQIRLSMQPLELIKRVKDIEQKVSREPETVQNKDTKQTAAVDLSKRLKDFRSLNDAASLKALEEWRKRKMERVRLRELEKNGTVTSQT